MQIKKILIPVLALALFSSAYGVDVEKASKKELKTLDEKVSYLVGLDMARSLKSMPIEVDIEALIWGIQDMLQDREPQFTQEQSIEVQKEYQAKAELEMKLLSEKNKVEGEKFLEQNKNVKGVITTKSGLQYQVLKQGDGPIPALTDRVTANYVGTLISGKEFDRSTPERGPFAFDVTPVPGRGGVIQGWTEIVKLMKVGSKYRVFIPSKLAYGERGSMPKIGPNEALIFEIELVSIEPPVLSAPGGGMNMIPGAGNGPTQAQIEEMKKMMQERMKNMPKPTPTPR